MLPLSISVVIATYNNSAFLDGCLQTLSLQVAPPARYEVIVVDNGSHDDTAAVVSKWSDALPVRYRFHPKQASFETAIARNAGMKEASGDIIVSLADDAIVPPEFLQRHAGFHAERTADCLVGRQRYLQQPMSPSRIMTQRVSGKLDEWADERDPQHHAPPLAPSAWVLEHIPWMVGHWDHLSLRRRDLLKVGWFDEWYSIYEEPDYELCYRLYRAGVRFCYDPSLVIYHAYRQRFPRPYWRGSGVDYLSHTFRDRTAALVSAAWRLRRVLESQMSLCLSDAYQRRQRALFAGLGAGSALGNRRITLGVLNHHEERANKPSAECEPGIEVLFADPRVSLTQNQSRTASDTLVRCHGDLIQALDRAQTEPIQQQARIDWLKANAQTDVLVLANQPSLHVDSHRIVLARPPEPFPDSSTITRALQREAELSSNLPEIGNISEGYSFPPRAVSFKLTNLCNLRCRMCGQFGLVGNALRQPAAENKTHMGLQDLQRIIDQVVPFRPGMVYIWGGEPFLHPAFVPFVNYVKRQNLFCIVTTNGTRLEACAAAVVEARLDILRVSLDGPPEVHDRIRGSTGLYDHVTRGITAIQDRKAALGSMFPLLEIICTISQGNYLELESAAAHFEGLRPDSITFVHQLYTPPAIGKRHQECYRALFGTDATAWQGFAQDVSGIDVVALSETIGRLAARNGPVPIGFSPPLSSGQVQSYYRDLTTLFHDKRCSGPWLWLEVYPNGDIYPCHEFPDYRVGNILTDGFEQVWNGPRFRKFRCQLMLHRGFPGCTACRSQQLVDAFVV